MRHGVFIFFIHTLLAYSEYGIGQITRGDTPDFTSLQRSAYRIITYHCGSCHTPGLKTSNPRALKIYDLSKGENWWRQLTPNQLQRSRTMLSDRTLATKAELEENFAGWRYSARAPTRDELRVYTDFVDSALLGGIISRRI